MISIKKILKPLYIRYSVLKFCLREYDYLTRHIGSSNTLESKGKMKYSLLKQSHVIEKGLSLKDVKFGFGVPKILSLLDDLEQYYQKYQDQEMLFYVLSIIRQYLDFHVSNNFDADDGIKRKYEKLAKKLKEDADTDFERYRGGALTKGKSQVSGASFDYRAFVQSRHSIRTFKEGPVSREDICRALEMAESTPSACNRQPWLVYVRTKKENIVKILDMQTGARQFKEQVAAIIVIASTAEAFSLTEAHQPYLNAGLYAMNLMLAFHSLGLGTIPLNLGIEDRRLSSIKKELGMPDDALPVLMLAIGQIPETLKVACSRRFDFNEYTYFD